MIARLPRFALAATMALIIATGIAVPVVVAAPSARGPVRSVAIVAPRWLYLDGELGLGVRVTTHDSTRIVTAGLDLLDGSGASVWHDTQSRADLGSVTYEYSFSKAVSDLGIAPGIYTLRVRVTSAGSSAIERSAQLIVVDRSMRAVPVTVIVRVAATPSPREGTPAASETRAALTTADDAADLGRLAELHPDLHLTIAVPPFLLEEWSGPVGSAEPTSGPTVGSEALASLRRAVLAGSPFLRGMYADPDLTGIAAATADLELQMTRGDAATAASGIGKRAPSAMTTGFAALSGPLPSDAATVLAACGVRYAVTDTASVTPARGAAATGAYAVTLPGGRSPGATFTVLAADRTASERLSGPVTAAGLAGDLFKRASSGQKTQTVVLVVAVGADGLRTAQLARSLEALAGIPWVRLVDAPTVAAATGLPAATLRKDPTDAAAAPAGYWTEIAEARARVRGLLAAAGDGDTDSKRAIDALLLAESRAWAGPDGSWPLAERGRALARSATAVADAVLGKVTLDAPSVTLPGSEGKAPVSIMNDSGRPLVVDLEAASSDVRVLQPSTTVRLRTGENVLSVPVSLGTSASGRVRFTVAAGGFRIATETATVTASYQDRIVLLVTVLLILAGLLFYIRRRVTRGMDERAERESPEDDPGA